MNKVDKYFEERKLYALEIIKCLDKPKGFSELAKCASPPYASPKEVWLDLMMLRVLGYVMFVPFEGWSLTEKGRRALKRLRR